MDATEKAVAELLERYENVIAGDSPDDSQYKVWQELVALVKGYDE